MRSANFSIQLDAGDTDYGWASVRGAETPNVGEHWWTNIQFRSGGIAIHFEPQDAGALAARFEAASRGLAELAAVQALAAGFAQRAAPEAEAEACSECGNEIQWHPGSDDFGVCSGCGHEVDVARIMAAEWRPSVDLSGGAVDMPSKGLWTGPVGVSE